MLICLNWNERKLEPTYQLINLSTVNYLTKKET